MKKLKSQHYVILLIICEIILAGIVAIAIGVNSAIGTLLVGIGAVIGLIIVVRIRNKSKKEN
ncbi:MAG: hypothetical protein II817_07860 [Bacteroidales bacterium]|nr:hypothetical protein [Bacteroidales bacterium]